MCKQEDLQHLGEKRSAAIARVFFLAVLLCGEYYMSIRNVFVLAADPNVHQLARPAAERCVSHLLRFCRTQARARIAARRASATMP